MTDHSIQNYCKQMCVYVWLAEWPKIREIAAKPLHYYVRGRLCGVEVATSESTTGIIMLSFIDL